MRTTFTGLAAILALAFAAGCGGGGASATPAKDASARLKAAIDAIDPDSLTPREALDALYALKGLLR